jgi:hypothetical protein
MIGCAAKCRQRWFHLSCVGLEEYPDEGELWYCTLCQFAMSEMARQAQIAREAQASAKHVGEEQAAVDFAEHEHAAHDHVGEEHGEDAHGEMSNVEEERINKFHQSPEVIQKKEPEVSQGTQETPDRHFDSPHISKQLEGLDSQYDISHAESRSLNALSTARHEDLPAEPQESNANVPEETFNAPSAEEHPALETTLQTQPQKVSTPSVDDAPYFALGMPSPATEDRPKDTSLRQTPKFPEQLSVRDESSQAEATNLPTPANDDSEAGHAEDEDSEYCYPGCGGIDHGPMIACDDGCQGRWYHWKCVGLSTHRPPRKKHVWRCPECSKSHAGAKGASSLPVQPPNHRPFQLTKPRSSRATKRAAPDNDDAKSEKRSRKSTTTMTLEEAPTPTPTPTPSSRGSPEPVYCICGQPADEDMIACDGNCKTEWFHYKCVGLTPQALPKAGWFCPACKVVEERKAMRAKSNR